MTSTPMGESVGLAAEPKGARERVRSANARFWTGRVMSGIAACFLAMDAAIKLLRLVPAVEATVQLGYPASVVPALGAALLACVAAYVFPRTAVLGAILLTGYLGGAIATHVRLGDPLLSHTLFPIYIGVLVWGGLWLRDARLGALVPFRLP